MAVRFNAPPNWPPPPEGWTPPKDWKPDPAWGPAPPGWNLWLDDNSTPGRPPDAMPGGGATAHTIPLPVAARKNWFARHKIITAAAALLLFIVVAAQLAGGGGGVQVANPAATPTTQPSEPATSKTEPSAPATSASTEPKPEPTETETTEPPEPEALKPIKYSGQGDKVLKIKKIADGPNLITFTHSGESNFIVSPLDSDLEEGSSLVNEIGDYKGTTILDLDDDANTKRIKIEADGRWTVKIAEISDATPMDSKAKGRGDEVLLYSGNAGVATLTHKGESNFIVYFYNEDSGENLVNEIGKYSGESVIGSGPGLLQIGADGNWTVKVDE